LALATVPYESEPKNGREPGRKRVFLVGNPNVGKSVLFNALTSSYAVVSNYPGTTVEVSRGKLRLDGEELEVVDTPGMYSLRPITEEERVARDLLLRDDGVIVSVVDAKNLPRLLPMTLELSMLGRPLILVCNLMDEAKGAGVTLDVKALSRKLGVPVVATVATRGAGLDELKKLIEREAAVAGAPFALPGPIGAAAETIAGALNGVPSAPFLALLHLEGDAAAAQIAPVEPEIIARARAFLADARPSAVSAEISKLFRKRASEILADVFVQGRRASSRWRERVDGMLLNPWTGFPVLAIVLYLGLYEFVGVFGGQVVVGWLENGLFLSHVNPWLSALFAKYVPWAVIRDLFVGDDGVLTMGIRYAVAIILPVVGSFFLAFSVLEDSGYLPRLALMLNRLFRVIGLNGRAVIPLILGFGCDTTATMVTRVLETTRERVIATFLLALAIPCSAQIGLILGLLGGHPAAMGLWIFTVAGIFLISGTLMARFLPGKQARFFMELPPLRVPSFKNVINKTMSRMGWYFLEVVPLFVLASVLVWIGNITGLFPKLIAATEPVMRALGLPGAASKAFLFGFFRRDYGAAGLYELQKAGALDGVQLLVSAVTLTLFLPCIAQFLMMKRERGWKVTLLMSGVILALAISVGWALNQILLLSGVTL
jgi:ferrous iron transport protein B